MSAGTPMRTEDDLRTALVSLEDWAPSADAVLRAVTDAAGRRRPGLARALRSPRSPRWPVLALGTAAAGTAAALTIALLPAGAPSGTGPRPGASRGGLPSAVLVGRAMLAASSSVNHDVLYWAETGVNGGVTVDTYRSWNWPAQPVTGQREITRTLFSERITRAAPLKLTEDEGLVYVARPASALNVHGRLTVVCYAAGAFKGGCGYGAIVTPPGTWSLHHGRFGNPNPGLEDLRPAALAREIVNGLWRVTGRTWVDGQRAIELTETPAGHYRPLPTLLWVNARTYLPLRMIVGARSPGASVDNWSYLKPTKANMALLRVPIPPSYPRSG
jgi:hypothetical protein